MCFPNTKTLARLLGTVLVRDFINTGDLVGALDRPETADRVEQLARELAPELTEGSGGLPTAQQAMLNQTMVDMMVNTVITEARKRTPDIVDTMKQRAIRLLTYIVITGKIIELGPDGLERIIYTVSRRELTFIEYHGGIFGFGLPPVAHYRSPETSRSPLSAHSWAQSQTGLPYRCSSSRQSRPNTLADSSPTKGCFRSGNTRSHQRWDKLRPTI